MKIIEKSPRGFCSCCGVQRNENGWMKHDECIWKGAADYISDVVETQHGPERTMIFCPYIPEKIKVNQNEG